jgi:hypothetical protein
MKMSFSGLPAFGLESGDASAVIEMSKEVVTHTLTIGVLRI